MIRRICVIAIVLFSTAKLQTAAYAQSSSDEDRIINDTQPKVDLHTMLGAASRGRPFWLGEEFNTATKLMRDIMEGEKKEFKVIKAGQYLALNETKVRKLCGKLLEHSSLKQTPDPTAIRRIIDEPKAKYVEAIKASNVLFARKFCAASESVKIKSAEHAAVCKKSGSDACRKYYQVAQLRMYAFYSISAKVYKSEAMPRLGLTAFEVLGIGETMKPDLNRALRIVNSVVTDFPKLKFAKSFKSQLESAIALKKKK